VSARSYRRKILGQKETLDDARLALKLIVRHADRQYPGLLFEALLRPDELPVRKKLQEGLDHEFPAWTRSLRVVTEKFDDWLARGFD